MAKGVFKSPAWSSCKDELDKRSGVGGWVIHDIRRSVATGMADIGIAPHIIERCLTTSKRPQGRRCWYL